MCTRTSGGVALFYIDRGKAPYDERFYTDRRLAMDLLLKGLKLTRPVGSENILVTSVGPAGERHGISRPASSAAGASTQFAVPYVDAHLLVMFLPTPDGYVGMAQFVPRGSLEIGADQLTFLSDYFYVSYSGTLAQWKSFLAHADLRTPVLDGVTLARDAAGLHYRSRRIDLDVPPNLIKLSDDEHDAVADELRARSGQAHLGRGRDLRQ